ncbi:TIM barrel protein [Cetobacterium sp. 8H]|uniref:TIM barrel protein n=1 Tax=Cetobacterium sp. 8H TaxID=2759681 RepID=UPI00163BC08A|nr:TIM barrel protein [Cetobacterium sp. 8H]MBC2850710.1 TIM barrel protein [Cetobacterium sp. 8H]
MISFSFVPKEGEKNIFFESFKRLKKVGISGIETIVGDHLPLEEYEDYPIEGVHLLYYPTWLEFWRGEKEKVREDFYNDEGILTYYRSFDKNILIETFKNQFEQAKKLNVKYMVFHVSHVRPKDIFTMEFDYNSEEVLKECLVILNEVFKGDGPLLLFENLPWPGLTLKNYEETKMFLDGVDYKNKGLLLDLSHIICTEKTVDSFQSADKFILNSLDGLKELKNEIYGIHVNGIKFEKYLERNFSKNISEWEQGDRRDKFMIEWEHMKNVDPHLVYMGDLKKIVEALPSLKHITFELNFKSLNHLEEVVAEQMSYLK